MYQASLVCTAVETSGGRATSTVVVSVARKSAGLVRPAVKTLHADDAANGDTCALFEVAAGQV